MCSITHSGAVSDTENASHYLYLQLTFVLTFAIAIFHEPNDALCASRISRREISEMGRIQGFLTSILFVGATTEILRE